VNEGERLILDVADARLENRARSNLNMICKETPMITLLLALINGKYKCGHADLFVGTFILDCLIIATIGKILIALWG